MGYNMKNSVFERERRRVAKLGRAWTTDDDKLSNTAYVRRVEARRAVRGLPVPSHPLAHLSACPFLHVLSCTPVLRANLLSAAVNVERLGVGAHARSHDHVDDRRRVYRGLVATNLVHVLPGTYLTSVVYESCSSPLRRAFHPVSNVAEY